MNDIIGIAGIGIISAAAFIILKQYRPEFAFGVILASGLLITVFSLVMISDLSEHFEHFSKISEIGDEKIKILLRCSGICIITKIASETCRDCGVDSVSSRIEFAGKIFILLSALPLFAELTEIISALLKL